MAIASKIAVLSDNESTTRLEADGQKSYLSRVLLMMVAATLLWQVLNEQAPPLLTV